MRLCLNPQRFKSVLYQYCAIYSLLQFIFYLFFSILIMFYAYFVNFYLDCVSEINNMYKQSLLILQNIAIISITHQHSNYVDVFFAGILTKLN